MAISICSYHMAKSAAKPCIRSGLIAWQNASTASSTAFRLLHQQAPPTPSLNTNAGQILSSTKDVQSFRHDDYRPSALELLPEGYQDIRNWQRIFNPKFFLDAHDQKTVLDASVSFFLQDLNMPAYAMSVFRGRMRQQGILSKAITTRTFRYARHAGVPEQVNDIMIGKVIAFYCPVSTSSSSSAVAAECPGPAAMQPLLQAVSSIKHLLPLMGRVQGEWLSPEAFSQAIQEAPSMQKVRIDLLSALSTPCNSLVSSLILPSTAILSCLQQAYQQRSNASKDSTESATPNWL